MKGILDALEAVLILMCIGMLVGTWILSGTVPTLIYYGLSVITPELFLPVSFLGTLVVGIVLGSWGRGGDYRHCVHRHCGCAGYSSGNGCRRDYRCGIRERNRLALD